MACRTSTAWAATSAMTSASACCSSVSGPGWSRYRLSAPRRTAPTWRGNRRRPVTPASSAGPLNASHRARRGRTRSGSSTGRSWGTRRRMGPRPARTASCSMRSLTSSVVHTEPAGTSPDISMIPAPLMPATSAHTSHSLFVSSPGRAAGEPFEYPQSTFPRHDSRSSDLGRLRGARTPRQARCTACLTPTPTKARWQTAVLLVDVALADLARYQGPKHRSRASRMARHVGALVVSVPPYTQAPWTTMSCRVAALIAPASTTRLERRYGQASDLLGVCHLQGGLTDETGQQLRLRMRLRHGRIQIDLAARHVTVDAWAVVRFVLTRVVPVPRRTLPFATASSGSVAPDP